MTVKQQRKPRFNRNHHAAIARRLAFARTLAPHMSASEVIDILSKSFAKELLEDNPKFNAARFVKQTKGE